MLSVLFLVRVAFSAPLNSPPSEFWDRTRGTKGQFIAINRKEDLFAKDYPYIIS